MSDLAEAFATAMDMPYRRTEWTAAELVDKDWPPIRWAVPGIFPQGLTLLAGAPKLGKSWLALCVGVAVAAGGTALGRIPVEQGPVLYLALEDTGRRLGSRLRMVLDGDPAPMGMHFKLEVPKGLEALEYMREFADARQPRLIVVDTVQKIRAASMNRDEGSYQADYRFMEGLKSIADDFDVAVLGVHHVRKMAATDYVDAVSGTAGLSGAADTVAVLKRARSESEAVLHIVGRDVDETDRALKLVEGRWHLLDIPAAEIGMSDGRREVVAYLREHASGTPKQIADDTGLKPNHVRQLVRRMAEDGQLDSDGKALYFLPGSHLPGVA